MSLSEKAAYLRGLYDGMGMDASASNEAKLMSAMIEVMEEMAGHISENEESITAIADQLDDVTSRLEDMEDVLDDEDAADNEDDEDDLPHQFELECPSCGAALVLDEETLMSGQIECTACGETFEIDAGFDVDDKPEEPDGV